MSYLEGIILGIIQALTEFLPISSSGHLVIAKYVFNIKSNDLVLEVILHLGTLFSIIIFFFNDIKDLLKKSFIKKDYDSISYCFYLLIATFPAGITGVLFKSKIGMFFYNIQIVSISLVITGIFLFFTKYSYHYKQINWIIALSIGFVQIFALIPGISRSGITIATGMLFGLKNSEFRIMVPFFITIIIIAGVGVIMGWW